MSCPAFRGRDQPLLRWFRTPTAVTRLGITLRLFQVDCQPVCNGQVTGNATLRAITPVAMARSSTSNLDCDCFQGSWHPRRRVLPAYPATGVSADNCRYSRRVSCRSRIPGRRSPAKGWLQRLPQAGKLSRSRLRGLPHHGAIVEAGRT
jgi:hypothetical protein